jgi:hypothetical protein
MRCTGNLFVTFTFIRARTRNQKLGWWPTCHSVSITKIARFSINACKLHWSASYLIIPQGHAIYSTKSCSTVTGPDDHFKHLSAVAWLQRLSYHPSTNKPPGYFSVLRQAPTHPNQPYNKFPNEPFEGLSIPSKAARPPIILIVEVKGSPVPPRKIMLMLY